MSPLNVSRSQRNKYRRRAWRGYRLARWGDLDGHRSTRAVPVHDLSIDQVLRKDGATDERLSSVTNKPEVLQITLQRGQIAKQLAVDAGSAIHARLLPPELTGLHSQPPGHPIEALQLVVDESKGVESVSFGAGRPLRASKPVVDFDALR